MKTWEQQANITRPKKCHYKSKRIQQINSQASNSPGDNVHVQRIQPLQSSSITPPRHMFRRPNDSSLFRAFDYPRGKKRSIDNEIINNVFHHETDWIIYTSSNYLHGGHWTKYISSLNNNFLLYFNSIEFSSFYFSFFNNRFSLSILGLPSGVLTT
jgi:hypothetical protein